MKSFKSSNRPRCVTNALKPDEAKVKAIKKCHLLTALRLYANFLVWSIISTSSSIIWWLRHYVNCFGMTYTGLGRILSSKLLKLWNRTSRKRQSLNSSTIHSLLRSLSMPLRVVLVLLACRMGTLWPMPRALFRKSNPDMRKSRKNSSVRHLHVRNFMISSTVEKRTLKLTTSLLLQLSTSLFIPHLPVCNVCCYSFRGTIWNLFTKRYGASRSGCIVKSLHC